MKGTITVMLAAISLLCMAGLAQAAIDLDNLNWGVQYMIDNSQTVLGVGQIDRPRNNRGLAISPDGRYLYAGYNNPSSGYAVRKIDLTQSDYTNATIAHLVGVSRGKAIAVDDVGRVYLADGAAIKIYDAGLTTLQYTISVTTCEGVSLVRQGGQLVLYSSDRSTGMLARRLLTESGGDITGAALDASFGASGQVTLSTDLRGVEVDSAGRIWVADLNDNRVFRVSATGGSYDTVTGLTSPIDIGFDGNTALITGSTSTLISRYDADTLASLGLPFTAPFAGLKLTPTPATGGLGALEGIVVIPGVGFYVAGNGVNTTGGRSTYGRIDANSGWYNGEFYTDLYNDDNDPILFAGPVPEPGSCLALCAGLVGLAGCMLRKRLG